MLRAPSHPTTQSAGGSWSTQKVLLEAARILEVVAPGGIERYFEQIAPVLTQKGPGWTQRYYALAEEYGLRVDARARIEDLSPAGEVQPGVPAAG